MTRYKAFDCGDDCHPVRYTTFTKRGWFGRKRWGVFDHHHGERLNRLHTDEEALHNWLEALERMEFRERCFMENRERRRAARR
ncbi:hypothetical protein ABZ404_39060 [Streptomyces sp. NPDC005878]|uniref:hypothetical protein n=1 Tax=Streptomyces sp. NPDC005878 TaxID=3157077 RepID=UPI00340792B2